MQNECSQSFQIYLSTEKLRKKFILQSCKVLNDKIDGNINFAKLPRLKVEYSQKNIGIISRSDILRKILVLFPLPKKCALLYPKLCILNFPALGHCSAVRV